jgi:hypothetical protein
VARAVAMPAGTVDVQVDGEWSFAQTLRHLVMATDVWLRRAILRVDRPFHPVGVPHREYELDGYDMSVFSADVPSFAEVLDARAGRVAMVRDFLAAVTAEDLAVPRQSPWAPDRSKATLSCLHVILGEEWEHHRFAVRDLDTIEAGDGDGPAPPG